MLRLGIRCLLLLVFAGVCALAGTPPPITLQPISDRVLQGHGIEFRAASSDVAARWRWQKDGAVLAAGTSSRLTLRNLLPSDSGRYQAVAVSSDGLAQTLSEEAVLTVIPRHSAPGAVDSSFQDSLENLPKLQVRAMVKLADGTHLAAVCWEQIVGVGKQHWGKVYHLLADGRIDPTFDSGYATVGEPSTLGLGKNRAINCLLLHEGKVYVGGRFNRWVSGTGQVGGNQLVRLLPNGHRDTAFSSPAFATADEVRSLACQPSAGRIVLGLKNSPFLARVPVDGAATLSPWNTAGLIDREVNSIAVLDDGRVAVAGNVGTTFKGFALLLANGARDASFAAFASISDEVLCFAQDAIQGGFWLGGQFTSINGQTSRNLAFVNQAGTVTGALGNLFNGTIHCMMLESGRLVLGGDFTSPHVRLSRFLPTVGSSDAEWSPPALNSSVQSLVAADAQTLLLGGEFLQPHQAVARVFTSWAASTRLPSPTGSLDCSHQEDCVSLTVGAQLANHCQYQWYRNGALMRSTAEPELRLPHLREGDAGAYQVTVVANDGTFTTAATPVEVRPRPYSWIRRKVAVAVPTNGSVDFGDTVFAIPNPLATGQSVKELRLVLDVRHPKIQDLKISLSLPGSQNTYPAAVMQNTGRGADLAFATFQETGIRQLDDVPAPHGGTFAVAESAALKTLASRVGAAGLVLRISDANADGVAPTVSYAAVEFYHERAAVDYGSWSMENPAQAGNGVLAFLLPQSREDRWNVVSAGRLQHTRWFIPTGHTLFYEASEDMRTWFRIQPQPQNFVLRDSASGIETTLVDFRYASGAIPSFLRLGASRVP
jgi:hypothetical protein